MKSAVALVLGLAFALPLAAQETPRPNRVGWLEIFPEPLPDGEDRAAFELTSQFLRPDRAVSADGRTRAALDAEDWLLTFDKAWDLGSGRLNARLRVQERWGGLLDQFLVNYHTLLGTDSGGRELSPKWRSVMSLERDGRVVVDAEGPETQLMDLDLAWVRPFGTAEAGARLGVDVQAPTGSRRGGSGSGSWDESAGGAAWRRFGGFTLRAQGEFIHLGVDGSNPWSAVLARDHFGRGWAGAAWQGEGPGFWRGLGLSLDFGYTENPFRTGLPRMDDPGWQVHAGLSHRALPRWRFGFSEEAGTYFAPDLTLFAAYRFGPDR
ncbi:MAG TPA: DUF3187 family protein [Holophagaceae bacterium]|nr:DUF3187 family protein [Holophagaceae bacterium]